MEFITDIMMSWGYSPTGSDGVKHSWWIQFLSKYWSLGMMLPFSGLKTKEVGTPNQTGYRN